MNTVLEAPFADTLQSPLNKQEVGTVFTWGGRVLVGDEIKQGTLRLLEKDHCPFSLEVILRRLLAFKDKDAALQDHVCSRIH